MLAFSRLNHHTGCKISFKCCLELAGCATRFFQSWACFYRTSLMTHQNGCWKTQKSWPLRLSRSAGASALHYTWHDPCENMHSFLLSPKNRYLPITELAVCSQKVTLAGYRYKGFGQPSPVLCICLFGQAVSKQRTVCAINMCAR